MTMFYCGIDVAKHTHTVVVLDEQGQVVKAAFAVSNDRAGFDGLLGQLAEYAGQVQIGLEATGHYWLALYDTLTHRGYPVAVINPLQIRAYRKLDLRKRKTDRVDARHIAAFLRFAQPRCTDPTLPVIMRLRELTRFRFNLVQQKGDAKRRVLCVLDRVFPEYEQLFSDVFLRSSRALLAEAVTPDEFAAFDLSELEQLLHRVSRGRFGQERAEAIQRAACQSVGVSFLTDAAQIEMRCLLAQIDLLEQQVADVEAAIEQVMAEIPQYITTIDGIGPVTGAALVAEIGDVQRFDTLEKLVTFAGIDATVFKTGQFEGNQRHMSKRGSPYLRCALWQAAGASLQHNPELKTYYDKKRAEGKIHGVALGAVCRKLLARVYVILREQRPYVNH